MTWRGIVGKLLYPDAFEDYVRALKFGAWRPKFIIVHNTSAPDTANWQKRNPPITDEKWAQSLVGYLWAMIRNGRLEPHLVATPGGILAFLPRCGALSF